MAFFWDDEPAAGCWRSLLARRRSAGGSPAHVAGLPNPNNQRRDITEMMQL